MFKNKRFAVHSIFDSSQLSFSPIEYSKFKYGDLSFAHKFGNELFDFFLRTYLNSDSEKSRSFIVYSSPYSFLPTSSLYMTVAFYDRFIQFKNLSKEFTYDIKIGKIDRCHSYTSDYGAMSAQERYDLIKNDTYKFMDLPDPNSVLLFLDDISITGTHQLVIEKLLEENQIENESFFLYYAKLENKDIDPSFENELNYAHVKNVNDLIPLILSDSFKNTTRTTKFVLGLPESSLSLLIETIVSHQKNEILEELLIGAVNNNYHLEEVYSKSFDLFIKKGFRFKSV